MILIEHVVKMNILVKNLEQKYIDAVNFAKVYFNEKTTARTVLQMLLEFQKLKQRVLDVEKRNSELRAKATLLQNTLNDIRTASAQTLDTLEQEVKRYQNVTGSSTEEPRTSNETISNHPWPQEKEQRPASEMISKKPELGKDLSRPGNENDIDWSEPAKNAPKTWKQNDIEKIFR